MNYPYQNMNNDKICPDVPNERLMTIPLVIGYLKMNTAKRINSARNAGRHAGHGIGYFDRIVRIDREYGATVEYILTNPLRWGNGQRLITYHNRVCRGNLSRKWPHTCPGGQCQGRSRELSLYDKNAYFLDTSCPSSSAPNALKTTTRPNTYPESFLEPLQSGLQRAPVGAQAAQRPRLRAGTQPRG